MRNGITIILLVGIVGISINGAFAQEPLFRDFEIKASKQQAPVVDTKNKYEEIPANVHWIKLLIEYKTVSQAVRGSKDRYRWLDNVIFEYEVLLPTTDKAVSYVMLKGKVEYWSIPLDGESRQALALIHPSFIKRYAPGLKLRKSTFKNLHVKLKVTYNDALVGGAYYLPHGRTMADSKKMFDKAAVSTKLERIQNSVFGRDKTLWIMINPDSFELIKQKKD